MARCFFSNALSYRAAISKKKPHLSIVWPGDCLACYHSVAQEDPDGIQAKLRQRSRRTAEGSPRAQRGKTTQERGKSCPAESGTRGYRPCPKRQHRRGIVIAEPRLRSTRPHPTAASAAPTLESAGTRTG